MTKLQEVDPELAALLEQEFTRQDTTLQLIPSQSLVDEAILAAQGSILTNLTIEGYPEQRYFPGCEGTDEIDQIGEILLAVLHHPEDKPVQEWAQARVRAMCQQFPIYSGHLAPRGE